MADTFTFCVIETKCRKTPPNMSKICLQTKFDKHVYTLLGCIALLR